jgi:acyl carrier protein
MENQREVLQLLREVLRPSSKSALVDEDSPLLGAIPELDSTSVVAVITALEERFDISIGADELHASAFASVGTLTDFVTQHLRLEAASPN